MSWRCWSSDQNNLIQYESDFASDSKSFVLEKKKFLLQTSVRSIWHFERIFCHHWRCYCWSYFTSQINLFKLYFGRSWKIFGSWEGAKRRRKNRKKKNFGWFISRNMVQWRCSFYKVKHFELVLWLVQSDNQSAPAIVL